MADAYEELVGAFLADEDRRKFEQFVGQALSSGPKGTCIISGDPMTGKSTLLRIAQMILKDVEGVVYQHDGLAWIPRDTRYLFVASLYQQMTNDNPLIEVIRTTGNQFVPEEFHNLVALVSNESQTISRICREQYNRATDNVQEN